MIEPQVGQTWSYCEVDGRVNLTIRLVGKISDGRFKFVDSQGKRKHQREAYMPATLKRLWHIELGPEIKGSAYWRDQK